MAEDESAESPPQTVVETGLARSKDTEYAQLVRELDPERRRDKIEYHLRETGKALREVALGHLEQAYESGIPLSNLINLMHAINMQGWLLFDHREAEDPIEQINSGQYRDYWVSVGDIIPPKPKDCEELIKSLGQKLDLLLYQARSSDAEIIASWAFAVFEVIHPFQDGNGRTGRTLVDFITAHVERQKGLTQEKRKAPEPEEPDAGEFTDSIESLQRTLNLIPEPKIQGSLVDWFTAKASAQEQAEHLNRERQLIQAHIGSIKSVEDLYDYPELKHTASFIKVRLPEKGQTRSLMAEDAVKAFQKPE